MAVNNLCEDDLAAFYRGGAGITCQGITCQATAATEGSGEGWIWGMQLSRITEGYADPSSHLQELISRLDLGSVVPIGSVCERSDSACPWALRRYLDACPILPATDAQLPYLHDSRGQRDVLPDRYSSGMGVIDVLFARQCLVRAYPSLLSPPTLAMQHGGHTGPPGGRWPAYKPPKSGPGLNCAAAGAALAMHCSECATDAACVENRTVASVTTNRKKQCDASDLGEMVDIDKSTWGPRVNLSQVTKLWLEANPSVPLWETVLPELRPCETTHEEHATFVVDGYPTCECYEQHTGCAAAMEDAMVAMHEHPGGCGSALPPPSAVALMLAASRGQRRLPVLEGWASAAAARGLAP